MSEEATGAAGTQVDPGTQPPAGTPPTQADGGTEEQQAPTYEERRDAFLTGKTDRLSPSDAKKLRSEHASQRTRLNALEDAEKARADAELSDKEKAEQRAAKAEDASKETERKARERVLKHATRAEAIRVGIEPDLAYRLLDQTAIEFDDEGEPTNVVAQVAKLGKDYPQLVSGKSASADGGVRGGPTLTLEAIKKLTPAEYENRREEVHAFLVGQQKH